MTDSGFTAPFSQPLAESGLLSFQSSHHPGFVLKQIHGAWDKAAKDMKWEAPEFERWPTLRKAQERCRAWRETLRAQGFDCSDMDFL